MFLVYCSSKHLNKNSSAVPRTVFSFFSYNSRPRVSTFSTLLVNCYTCFQLFIQLLSLYPLHFQLEISQSFLRCSYLLSCRLGDLYPFHHKYFTNSGEKVHLELFCLQSSLSRDHSVSIPMLRCFSTSIYGRFESYFQHYHFLFPCYTFILPGQFSLSGTGLVTKHYHQEKRRKQLHTCTNRITNVQ